MLWITLVPQAGLHTHTHTTRQRKTYPTSAVAGEGARKAVDARGRAARSRERRATMMMLLLCGWGGGGKSGVMLCMLVRCWTGKASWLEHSDFREPLLKDGGSDTVETSRSRRPNQKEGQSAVDRSVGCCFFFCRLSLSRLVCTHLFLFLDSRSSPPTIIPSDRPAPLSNNPHCCVADDGPSAPTPTSTLQQHHHHHLLLPNTSTITSPSTPPRAATPSPTKIPPPPAPVPTPTEAPPATLPAPASSPTPGTQPPTAPPRPAGSCAC
jgi:hypothetical protein